MVGWIDLNCSWPKGSCFTCRCPSDRVPSSIGLRQGGPLLSIYLSDKRFLIKKLLFFVCMAGVVVVVTKQASKHDFDSKTRWSKERKHRSGKKA